MLIHESENTSHSEIIVSLKYLTAMLIHEPLDVDTNGARALIEDGELWPVVEETSHLKPKGLSEEFSSQSVKYTRDDISGLNSITRGRMYKGWIKVKLR